MTEIEERVGRIEQALVAIGALQFGDSAGHPFRGNQYGGGGGGERPVGRGARAVGSEHYGQGVEHARNEIARGADPHDIMRESRDVINSNRAGFRERSYHEGRIDAANENVHERQHPDDVAAYQRARESSGSQDEAIAAARASAAERNARTSGTDPSWYGQ